MKTDRTSSALWRWPPWTVGAAVFAVAFGLRLLFLLSAIDRHWPHSIAYEGDAVIWARAAELFARGEVPDEGVPHRFYAIAYLFKWLTPSGAQPNFLLFKVAWSAVSALSVAATYISLQRHVRPRVAAIATGLYALSFGSYVLSTSLNVEGLYTPVLVMALAGLWELSEDPRWWLVGALACLNALALLLREEHLILLFALTAYLVWFWGTKPQSPDQDSVPRPFLAARVLMSSTLFFGSIALCLPYSVQATRATIHYNTVPRSQPSYDQTGLTWSPEARALIESLPAFVRVKAVEFVNRKSTRDQTVPISSEQARQIVVEEYGGLPQPLSTPVFIASHGPMSFALSNHPDSDGGFSRAALEIPGQQGEPRLNLALPQHLRIFNHGYAVGWGYMTSAPGTWLVNVGKKLAHAAQGASLGFTAYNLPWGRFGQRRSCDLLTPFEGIGWLWQLAWCSVLILGGRLAWKQRHTGIGLFLLVIAYKITIVVLYYGYARQAASILPVIFVLAALGIDQLLNWLEARWQQPGSALARQAITVALLSATAALDLHAAIYPRDYQVVGTIRPLPQWGNESFGANAPIELRPTDFP